jgi:hypothetical protein
LRSDRAAVLSAQQLADLIYRETGQVTTKGAVTGKLNRLREERMRQELAEDLAASRNRGTTLRAGGPFGWDALLPDEWRERQPQGAY